MEQNTVKVIVNSVAAIVSGATAGAVLVTSAPEAGEEDSIWRYIAAPVAGITLGVLAGKLVESALK